MNNFDDLFEQRPQAEAAPQKQKSQKERPKRQWWQVKEEKHRKEAYATLDKIFGEFSEGTGSMEAYLDVQSRFPFHSARNGGLYGIGVVAVIDHRACGLVGKFDECLLNGAQIEK